MSEIVLTKNYFLYGEDFFLQTHGTAMQTFLCVGLNTNMCTIIIHSHKALCFGNNIDIDGIFLIWNGSNCDLQAFSQYLNNCNDSIEFNIKCDSHKVTSYTWVIYNGRYIYTTLFTKPSGINSPLHYSNYQSVPLKKVLPYSSFLRA